VAFIVRACRRLDRENIFDDGELPYSSTFSAAVL